MLKILKQIEKNIFPDFHQARRIYNRFKFFDSLWAGSRFQGSPHFRGKAKQVRGALPLFLEKTKQLENHVLKTSNLKTDNYKTVLAGGLLALCLIPHLSPALIPDSIEKETELNHKTPSSLPLPLQTRKILKELKEKNIDQIALDSAHKCILFNKDTGAMEECSEKEALSIVNSFTGEEQTAGLGDWLNDMVSNFQKSPLCITISETIGVSSGIISGLAIAHTLKDSVVAGAALIKVVGAGTFLTVLVVPTVAVTATVTSILILCDETEIDLPDWLDYIWYLG